jgi:uncharacterized protein
MELQVTERGKTKAAEARKRRLLRRVMTGVVILAVMVTVGGYGATVYLLNKAFSHRVVKMKYTPEALGLKAESVSLRSSDGIALKAWWVPATEPRGTVVVLHGMDGLDASCLLPQAKFLGAAGWSAIVLDMRAHGRSGGNRIGLAIEEPRDVAAALDWLHGAPLSKGKPVVLLGLSMGGATAIRAAAMRPDVDAVISVSAFSSLEPMIGEGVQLWYARLAIRTLYGVWPADAAPVHDIARISPRPVLLMHGTADKQIPADHASRLMEAGTANVTLCLVPGADHLVFTKDGNSEEPLDVRYRTKILEFLGGVQLR